MIYRGSANSRMKDFHDLYSLVSLPNCLNTSYTEKVVINVFNHRQTSIENLPLNFDSEAKERLQHVWHDYHQQLQLKEVLPSKFEEIVFTINHWLSKNTSFCDSTLQIF
ncbi:MAG: nucleotidyl transferase AbiEii/AbiGii toxin family protein [Chlamydiota bacterium]